MRLTNVLLKQSYRWRFKTLWQHKARFAEPSLVTPFTNTEGITVTKGSDIVAVKYKFPKWQPPVPDDIQCMPIKTPKDLPDYHDEPVYEFTPVTRLIEGENQALVLTKSKPFYELPPTLLNLIGRLELPDQDLLVQRVIMQSNIWDPTKYKLSRRLNTRIPGWKFKAEFGIPNLRIALMTTKNLLRLCESFGGRYPDLMTSRRLVVDPYLSTFYYFQGTKHVMIRGMNDLTTYTNRPLEQFASSEVVDESVVYNLPDIFPLAPTIDLVKQYVWSPENVTGYKDGFGYPHPHTLFMCYDNRWTTSQRNAKALMFCFGQAVASAKQRYGFDAKILPEPISVQCVSTNGIQFSFVCFQLNTLDIDSKNGVKNLVWFDCDNELFKKILPERSMLRNTRYEDYDPDVFKKLLAVYLYGANLESNQESNISLNEQIRTDN